MNRRILLLLSTSLLLAEAAPARADYAGSVAATPGLASYWRLGEASGTTAFDSRRARDGTYVNGPRLLQPPGPVGSSDGSVGFDGRDDSVNLGDRYDHAGVDPFSIEGWIRPARARGGRTAQHVVSKETSSATRPRGYAFVLSTTRAGARRGGRLTFERRSGRGADRVHGTTRLASGAWHHIAVSYDGARMLLYVNGRLDGSERSARALPTTRAPLRLGASSAPSSAFGGLIDEVAFYSRALRAATVRRHYERALASPAEPPAPAPPQAPSSVPAGAKATIRPPGSSVLGDAEAAARVRRSPWEPRPGNAAANQRVPSAGELSTFRTLSASQIPYVTYVTGSFTGTTDEIIQWAAHKWGLDEDVMRAGAAQESRWFQEVVGDGGASFGLMQIKSTVWRGTWPLSQASTAFNLDMHGAILRHCYDGRETWMAPKGYAAGDYWGCVGWCYSGDWYDPDAIEYRDSVQGHLAARTWQQPAFALERP